MRTDISIKRIEDASPGLAYAMRKYQSLFWHDAGGRYVLHVPKNRTTEYWTITKKQIEGADKCLKDDQPPYRSMIEAKPPGRPVRRKSLKGYSGKRA
jgi:hypothetical protein